MTCDEAQELITALVDQELLDPERPLLEMHLKECARCRFAVQIDLTISFAPEPPPIICVRLLSCEIGFLLTRAYFARSPNRLEGGVTPFGPDPLRYALL